MGTSSVVLPDTTLDYHAHILPGCDHGSDSVETSRRQLEMARKAGIATVCATPHFYPQRETVACFLDRRAWTAELLRAGYTDITLPVRDAARIAVTEAALRRLGVHAPEGALKIIETPLTDPVRLDEKVRDIDTVFNCAARIMSGDMTTEQLIANNVAIARSVTNWCLTTGVRKLIHVSSISALGNPTGPGLPVTEECDPESVTDYAAYGQSKYYSEQEVRRGAAAGLPTVIVSPGVILGEGDTTGNNRAALIPVFMRSS